MEDYPSNSHKSKETPKARPAEKTKLVEPVISGEAVLRKKPLGRRFRETFFSGDDAKTVIRNVFSDTLIPATRDLIYDVGEETLRRSILGDSSPGRRGRPGSNTSGLGHVAYHNISQSLKERREDPRDRGSRGRGTSRQSFDDIVLETRVEADAVLERMFDILSQYNVVGITDLYDMVRMEWQFTDVKYGWTDLQGAQVRRIPGGGYLLDLPRPVVID